MRPLLCYALSAVAAVGATDRAIPQLLGWTGGHPDRYESSGLDNGRLSSDSAVRMQAGVPSYMLSMGSQPPLEIAFLLADASVPCGIELREADDVYPELPSKPALDRSRRVPIEDFVRAFNSARRDYRASLTDATIVIRPTTGILPFLDSPSAIAEPVTVTGTMDALRRVFSPLDSRLLGPTIGTGIGSEVAKNLTRPFVLDGSGGRRVIDTLNQIARQVPGAWQTTTRDVNGTPKMVAFGFIYTDRSRSMNSMEGQ